MDYEVEAFFPHVGDGTLHYTFRLIHVDCVTVWGHTESGAAYKGFDKVRTTQSPVASQY